MFPIALLAALAAGALAQTTTIVPPVGSPVVIVSASSRSSLTTTTDPTIDPTVTTASDTRPAILIPEIGHMESGYAASIKTADACSTVLVLGCDKAADIPNEACGYGHLEATMTVGPGYYNMLYSTTDDDGDDGSFNLEENCQFGDKVLPLELSPTATCTWSSPNLGTIVELEWDYDQVKIPITEGAKKLPTGDATCTKPVPSSKPTSAAPAVVLQIQKLLVPLVLAAVAQALL